MAFNNQLLVEILAIPDHMDIAPLPPLADEKNYHQAKEFNLMKNFLGNLGQNVLIKLDPLDPDGNKIYRSNGTLIDLQSLIYNGVTPTVTASVVTNYNIDPQLETEHWNLTMIGDTDFDFTNMFDADNSKVITITLKGDYAFTFPSWLKPLETNDNYDTIGGTLIAEIVINIKNGGTNPSGYYSLEMVDYAL